MKKLKPVIEQWYLNRSGAAFEVVAIDDHSGNVEVQYFDGTVDELDEERWARLPIEEIHAPEDLSGSLDLPRSDMARDIADLPRDNWRDTLDVVDLEYVEIEE